MRFSSGWTKAYRRQAEGDLHQNLVLWALWNSLRDRAYWREGSLIWRGKKITVYPGQVIIGLKEYAALWDVAKSTVKYWLDYLVSSERITYETSNKGTLVTILNWEKYQGEDETVERQPNEVRTASEQQPPLSEEGKKVRRKNSKSSSQTTLPVLAKLWNEHSSPSQPKVRGCSNERRRKAQARLNEGDFRDPKSYWIDIIKRIASSKFCNGENDRGWVADFDFLIRPDTHHKVLEGKYNSGKAASSALDELQRRLA